MHRVARFARFARSRVGDEACVADFGVVEKAAEANARG
jgi:hypothetical protein